MGALRACVECGTPSDQARCPAHRRGTTTQRGYGWEHQQRQQDPEYLEATHCTTCGQPFTEDNPKTAGHVVAQRHHGTGHIEAQCQDCNYGWRRTGT